MWICLRVCVYHTRTVILRKSGCQIIQIAIWKMKNSVHSSVHTLKDTWDFRARGISDCGKGSSWRDWNHARKFPRLAWAGWGRPWVLTSDRSAAVIFFFDRNQYQESSWGKGPLAGVLVWQPPRHLQASTPYNSMGLHGLLQGELYLFFICT
jgi:hypothetical protein